MKTRKIKDVIARLKLHFPKIDSRTRFLYDGRLDRKAKSNAVKIYIIAWSDDGRATIHETIFRKPGLSLMQWHAWLREHTQNVVQNQVRAYMSRVYGSNWHIEKIFGWHFDRSA